MPKFRVLLKKLLPNSRLKRAPFSFVIEWKSHLGSRARPPPPSTAAVPRYLGRVSTRNSESCVLGLAGRACTYVGFFGATMTFHDQFAIVCTLESARGGVGGRGAWLWGGLKSTTSALPRPLARGSGAVLGNAASASKLNQHKPAAAIARKKDKNNSKAGKVHIYTCGFNGDFG